MTIIPNFLETGVLTIVFGLIVAVWAGWFVQRKKSKTKPYLSLGNIQLGKIFTVIRVAIFVSMVLSSLLWIDRI
jgi:hypothetical protein